jgi:hypothetical protein
LIGDLGLRIGRYWCIVRLGEMGWYVAHRGAIESGGQKWGG